MPSPDSAGSVGTIFPDKSPHPAAKHFTLLPPGHSFPQKRNKTASGSRQRSHSTAAAIPMRLLKKSVTEHHADVIDLEACLWSQCYDFMANQDWDSAADLLDFEVLVK